MTELPLYVPVFTQRLPGPVIVPHPPCEAAGDTEVAAACWRALEKLGKGVEPSPTISPVLPFAQFATPVRIGIVWPAATPPYRAVPSEVTVLAVALTNVQLLLESTFARPSVVNDFLASSNHCGVGGEVVVATETEEFTPTGDAFAGVASASAAVIAATAMNPSVPAFMADCLP